jgi:hypothetical protein
MAQQRFKQNPKGFANLDDARQDTFNQVALATEKKALRAPGEQVLAGRVTPQVRAEMRQRYRDLRNQGYSWREAGIITRQIATGTPDDFALLGSTMRRQMDALLKVELDAGAHIQALNQPGLFYLMHWINPEAKALMGMTGRLKFVRKFNEMYAGHPSMLRRGGARAKTNRMAMLLRGSAIPELNASLKAWALKEFPELRKARESWLARGRRGADPGEIFVTNPLKLVAERARRTGKAATAGTAMEDALDNFASPMVPEAVAAGTHVPIEDVLQPLRLRTRYGIGGRGVRAGEAGIPTKLARFEGQMIHKELANAVTKTFQRYMDPQAPGFLLRNLDRMMNLWKTGVTVLFPEFHFRNMVSNVWANYLGDVVNPMVYTRAFEIMRDFQKGGNKTWTFGNRTMTTREVIHSMEAGRALGFGSTMVDAELSAGKMPWSGGRKGQGVLESRFGKVGALAREAAPLAVARGFTNIPFVFGGRSGKAIGGALESHAKIAHVVDKLNKGWSMEAAILSAKKYLFDYGELTPFERMYMRRLVPFYTWFRKNTPLQLETLVTKPGKIAVLRHLQQAAEDEPVGSVDTSVLPDWIRRRWHSANMKSDGSIEFLAGLGLGTEDLAIFDHHRTLSDLLSMLNPILKGGAEMALNRDFFRDIPLDRSEYAPGILAKIPDLMGLAGSGARRLGQDFLDHIGFMPVKEKSGETRFYRANPRWLAVLRAFPATGAASRFAATAEKMAQAERSTYDPIGKFWTGVKRGQMGVEKQMLNLLYLEREVLTSR